MEAPPPAWPSAPPLASAAGRYETASVEGDDDGEGQRQGGLPDRYRFVMASIQRVTSAPADRSGSDRCSPVVIGARRLFCLASVVVALVKRTLPPAATPFRNFRHLVPIILCSSERDLP